jgi:ribosomal protein L32
VNQKREGCDNAGKEKTMAVKKAKRSVAKRSSKAVSKKAVKKGDVYKCSVCGLSVVVDEICGCVDTCDIICCEKEMKPKRRA